MRVLFVVAALLCVVGSSNAKTSVATSSVSLKSGKSDFSIVSKAAAAAAAPSKGKAVAKSAGPISDSLKETLKLVGLFTLWYNKYKS